MQLNVRFGCRRLAGLGGFAVMLAGLAIVPSAMGEPIRIQARQDAQTDNGTPSYFQLNFFDQDDQVINGTPAFIASTQFELEIDGAAGTAHYVSYAQNVDSLILPNGVETGALHIELVSSVGTYDRATGTFQTNDSYLIQFENDLSALGFPGHEVILDSPSGGTISAPMSRISIEWGRDRVTGVLPFDFGYICSLSAFFATTPSSYIETTIVPMLLAASMPENLRNNLMFHLDEAIAYYNDDRIRAGSNALYTFIYQLRRLSSSVAQADANALMDAAYTAIALAEHRPDQALIRTDSDLNDAAVFDLDSQSKNTSDRIVK